MGRCDYEGAQACVAEPVLMLTLNTPVSYSEDLVLYLQVGESVGCK